VNIITWIRQRLCRHFDSRYGLLTVDRGHFVLVRCHRCGRVAVSDTLVEVSDHAS